METAILAGGLALVSVIIGSLLNILPTIINNRQQKQHELQSYRKQLIEKYLDCIERFDLLLNQVKQYGVKEKTSQIGTAAEDKEAILSHMDELRALVIRASSLLKATGDFQLVACGWILYQEALSNVDKHGLTFDLKSNYNPIHYFRVALDLGLMIFAYTISNNLPPSRKPASFDVIETIITRFKKQIEDKYKNNPDYNTSE
ncbi:MAG: hypothetical protein SFZ02_18670 [bacterium]|nr:hypothetical protein [bacterium]